MEKEFKCVLLLSLKKIALRSVVTCLWNDPGVLASISSIEFFGFSTLQSEKKWQETVEDKIKDKLSVLNVPASIMKELRSLVRPINLGVREWKRTHQGMLDASNNLYGLPGSAKLCFTAAGSVDYRKTAEELVRCSALNVVERYEIACWYCLEDFIPLLWGKLSEGEKANFCNKRLSKLNLPSCWPHILKGEFSRLDYLLQRPGRNLTSFNQYAFEYTGKARCKTAADYFFRKLTHEEREASLMRTARAMFTYFESSVLPEERQSDVLLYFLSLMTSKQKMEIFNAHSLKVALCFLDWPWHDLFSENAELIWASFPPSSYGDLMREMFPEYSSFGFSHTNAFHDFFMKCPSELKKMFVAPQIALSFLYTSFECEDSESIEVIFRNLNAAERLKLVLNERVLIFLHESILKDQWKMVEVCLREASLTEADKERVGKEFLKCNDLPHIGSGNQKLKTFYEFLSTKASIDKEQKVLKRKLEECCSE